MKCEFQTKPYNSHIREHATLSLILEIGKRGSKKSTNVGTGMITSTQTFVIKYN